MTPKRAKKWVKAPVLSKLLVSQIVVVISVLAAFGASYHFFSHAEEEAIIKRQKEHILPRLERVQEQWRTWKYMGLEDALEKAIKKFESPYAFKTLRVMERAELPEKLNRYALILPQEVDPIIGNVVYAELSPKAMKGVEKAHRRVYILILSLGLGFVCVILLSGRYVRKEIIVPVAQLAGALRDFSLFKNGGMVELKAAGEVAQLLQDIELALRENRHFENVSTTAMLTSKLAHDIRSPLSALKMAVSHLSELPEDKRLLIRSAVQRLADIAYDLSVKGQQAQRQVDQLSKVTTDRAEREGPTVKLISQLVESVVSAKRIEFKPRPDVDIEFRLGVNSYGLFATVVPTIFTDILAEILTNSLESIEGSGKIQWTLSQEAQKLCLILCDSGVGIPADKRAAYLKVMKHMRAWGGEVKIDSQAGQGTVITIHLPLAPRPPWFAEHVAFTDDSRFFILDDDPSIHQIWETRLHGLNIDPMRLIHFKTPEEFLSAQLGEFGGHDVFLFDYELMGFSKTGLDVIRELGVPKQCILMTYRFDDEDLRQGVYQQGAHLLPKSLLEFIPVVKREGVELTPTPDCILIDDDELVHTYWRDEAEIMGKTIAAFTHPDDFMRVAARYPKTTPVYVDANLANGLRGEDVSRKIRDLGFENVYLATGLDSKDFPPMSWLKGIVGKNPPWDKLN